MSGARLAFAAAFAVIVCSCAEDQARPARSPHARHALKKGGEGPVDGVRCGTIWDPVLGVIEDGRIVFDGSRIVALGAASKTPAEGDELDLRPLFCMPGLVDAHTHLTSYAHESASDDLEKRRKQAAHNALLTLRAGVTSVRDLGGGGGVDMWLRDRIASGALPGPRMQCAGSQIGVNGAVGGPAGAKAAVDAHADAGFDVIKVFATGGPRDPVPLMTADELLAAADEAHARHLKIASHAIASDGIARSIAAHVDSVEHGSELSVDQAKEMVAAGITLVPTFYILRYYVEDAEELGFSQDHVADLREMVSTVLVPFEQRFPSLLATGVKVAMGSDAFMALHGKNARELSYMVKAGMSAEEAMRAATSTSAALMGWDGKVGTVAPGGYADVVVTQGDPRKDVSVLEHVQVVVKSGVVLRDDRR